MDMNLVSENVNLNERIQAFVAHAQGVIDEEWHNRGFQHAKPTFQADYASDKWVKVWRMEMIGGALKRSSIYAFICLQDYTTKTLGALKTGDIHLPASTKIPAKHARGNVFQEDFNKCAGPYGIVYLRN